MDLRFRLLLCCLAGGMALMLTAVAVVLSEERQDGRGALPVSLPLAPRLPTAATAADSVRVVLARPERSDPLHLSQPVSPDLYQPLSHFATDGAAPAAVAPTRWQAAGRMAAVLTPLALLLALAAWWWAVRALHGHTVGARRLSAALEQAGADLRRLREEAMAAREAERQALARELHDEFGQNLTVMQTAAAYLERHATTAPAQMLGECARDIRLAATQMARQVQGQLRRLHGADTHGRELRAELDELVRGHWLQAAGLQVELHCPVVLPTLSQHARLALYRTAQEALTNVVRHAGARRVRLTVAPASAGLTVCIEDDGHGTDVRAALRSSRSGLRGMRERAAAAHGRLRLRASALGGLRVSLWLPESGHVDNNEEGDTHHGERTAAG